MKNIALSVKYARFTLKMVIRQLGTPRNKYGWCYGLTGDKLNPCKELDYQY